MKKKYILYAILIVALAGIGYGIYFSYTLYKNLGATQQAFASSTASYEIEVHTLQDQIASLQHDNESINGVLSDEQKKSLELQKDKEENEKQIDTLQKLTTIDPELLKKYSKIYFLSENYSPPKLADIDEEFRINPDAELQILQNVQPFLEDMLNDANDDGIPLRVVSAYRSFETQMALKTGYKVTYGAGTANSFSADQGYSEHQLGTALDFTTPTIKGAYPAFETSTSFTWLTKNAYKYGFILSYPKDNSYYISEPWHWRFVGKQLAKDLHDEGKYFYELDQREIDSYLIKLFDN